MRCRLILCLLAFAPVLARATSVVPPEFSQLVAEADAIYRGGVTSVEARRAERPNGGSVIKTYVTIAIQRTLKGPEQPTVTLEFLGGTIGDETLEVGGVPKFTTGQRGYVFVQKNGRQFCPLVRLGHGRYRIARDEAGQKEFVQRDNGTPLREVGEVQLPLTNLPLVAALRSDPAEALTPSEFENRIAQQVRLNAEQAAQP